MKDLINDLMHRIGYHIRKYPILSDYQQDLAQALADLNVDLVIDVGAHRGEFALSLRRMGYTDRIVSFEPVKATRVDLETLAAADPRWSVVPCALGASAGTATINITADEHCDSLLVPTDAARNAPGWKGWFQVTGTEEIALERLDRVWASVVRDARNVLLKSDTQGFDLEVLRGAGDCLGKLVGVQLEVAMAPLYEGAPAFADVDAYLQDAGFFLSAIDPLYRPDKRVTELDALYLNSNAGTYAGAGPSDVARRPYTRN